MCTKEIFFGFCPQKICKNIIQSAQGLLGPGSQQYVTIMAYTWGGKKRINYFSNPHVIFPSTGTPTGEGGKSDNAAVLLRNRFKIADMGDESLKGKGLL